jgi:DNA-binding LacI/PurR family transcriptional regulator
MSGKPPTMRDVAEMAGVSVQTVSCVVNGTGSISTPTRRRVLKAINTLNYRRDSLARSMRTRQTNIIGLMVLDIINPVLSILASAVENAANAHGYRVMLHNTGMKANREWESLEASVQGLVDGLIIVNMVEKASILRFLEEERIHAVVIDCLPNANVPSVRVDNTMAAYIATEHAIGLGHRQIAHVTGSSQLSLAEERIEGYLKALSAYGLSYQRLIISETERWDYSSGYAAMRDLLQDAPVPTAVFFASDQMAIGAYRAIIEAGLRVPDDISIIGFDDIEAASFSVPSLTTIRQPFTQMASSAFDLLLDLISGNEVGSPQLVLPPELIVRGSTAEVANGYKHRS